MNLALVLSLVLTCCQSNIWNGIVPLKSTRKDVEKLLGKPMPYSKARHAATYKTKEGKVFILYSTGPCRSKPSNGWRVPELTVISVSVELDDGPNITDLKLDEHKFEKGADPEILNLGYFTNEADGISLTVDKSDGKVTRFSYFPESKYNYLKCKKAD